MTGINIGKAENNIAPPRKARGAMKEVTERFNSLKIGESFLVSLDQPLTPRGLSNFRQYLRATVLKAKTGSYVTRIEGNAVRIWKIEPAN
jgi:hypothetical protein